MTGSAVAVAGRPTRLGPARLVAALDRLGEVDPAAAARARTSIRAALAGYLGSKLGETAWIGSRLTPTGFPVELSVTSRRQEVRWVSEVIAPEDDPAAAVERAETIAVARGAVALDPAVREGIRAAQSGAVLMFGAWLGARHGDRDGTPSDTWKLYAELPREAGWRGIPADLGPAQDVLGGIAVPRFAGFGLDASGATELYARILPDAPDAVEVAFGRSRLAALVPGLHARLDSLGARRPAPQNLGLSVVVGPSGHVLAIAVFTFARQLFATDRQARARILALARQDGWRSADLYDALTRPLDRPPVAPGALVHGPISLVTHADGATETHIGLAPPRLPALQGGDDA